MSYVPQLFLDLFLWSLPTPLQDIGWSIEWVLSAVPDYKQVTPDIKETPPGIIFETDKRCGLGIHSVHNKWAVATTSAP